MISLLNAVNFKKIKRVVLIQQYFIFIKEGIILTNQVHLSQLHAVACKSLM